MPRRFHPAGVGLLLGLAALGCGGAEGRPSLHPVSGTVTVRGRPASGVLVLLHPADGSPAAAARLTPSATTAGDGTFRLSSKDQHDGAPAGEYTVTLRWFRDDPRPGGGPPGLGGPPPDQFKGKYGDPTRSPWRVTVSPGDNALEPFAVD